MNLVGADVVRENTALHLRFGEHRLALDPATLESRPGLAGYEGRRLILGIRPEDMEDAAVSGVDDSERCLDAVVDIREDMGSEVFVHFRVDAPPLRGEDVRAAVGEDALEASADASSRGVLFVARVDRESRLREGEAIRLSIDVRRLHFFDIESGDALTIRLETAAADGERIARTLRWKRVG